jgi:hypothetical protein
VLAVAGGDELGVEELGAGDEEVVVGAFDCGEFAGGVAPAGGRELVLGGAAGGAAAGVLDAPRVSLGGPSLLSIPTGTFSALCVVFATSVPVGTHVPVAIHGADEFGDVLCNAPPTVNNPSELPVLVPS